MCVWVRDRPRHADSDPRSTIRTTGKEYHEAANHSSADSVTDLNNSAPDGQSSSDPQGDTHDNAEDEASVRARVQLSDGDLVRVRSEAASAEQRASFLAALALLGLSDSIRSAFTVSRLLRQHNAEVFSLGVALAKGLIATVSFMMCGLSGAATLLDRGHLRLVRAAMVGSLSHARDRIGERTLYEAAKRGRGETTKVLEEKLVTGLRCTGWFLLGWSAWIVSKFFAT